MTTLPVPPRSGSTGVSGAAIALLGLGVVLGVMAVVFLVLGLWQHEDSHRVCGASSATIGECQVTADLAMREARLIWLGALTLAAGSVSALVAGGIAAALTGLRRS